MSIPLGSRVRYWPGARAAGIEPKHGQTITSRKDETDTNFGVAGYWIRKSSGGTDFIAETHIEQEEPAPTLVLFDDPEPPPTGVTVDQEDPAGWRYPPVRLRAVADALRPFLAAGVEPLEVAVLALDADPRSVHVEDDLRS